MDLVEEGLSNRLSWRRFMILVRGLPSESAYYRWLGQKETRKFAEWSEDAVYEGMQKSHGRKGGGK